MTEQHSYVRESDSRLRAQPGGGQNMLPSETRGLFRGFDPGFQESQNVLPSDARRDALTRAEAERIVDVVLRAASVDHIYELGSLLSYNSEQIEATVYDKHLDRKVALKLLLGEKATRELTSEAQVLERFEGPGVVAVYCFLICYVDDLARKAGLLFTEFIEGMSVREFVKEGNLGLDNALDYMATVCRTVQRAHSLCISLGNVAWTDVRIGKDAEPMLVDLSNARFGGDVFLDIQGLGKMLREIIKPTHARSIPVMLEGCETAGDLADCIDRWRTSNRQRLDLMRGKDRESVLETRGQMPLVFDSFIIATVGVAILLAVTGCDAGILISVLGVYGGFVGGLLLISHALRRDGGVLWKIGCYCAGFLLMFESILFITAMRR